jgi:hypothetical protein
MSTTDNVIPYDIRFVEHLSPYLELPKYKLAALNDFVGMGLVQRDRLVEMAIAKVGGLNIVSVNGRDFCDGSDGKSVVSSARNNNVKKGHWTNSYAVRRVESKTGPLRIVAYNQYKDSFQYFFVPHKAYQHLSKTLEIIIERHCSSDLPLFTGETNVFSKWWTYECKSFEEMCLKKV